MKDAAQLVQLRNEFYRDNYKRVVMALIIMIVTNLCLLGLVYYLLTHSPQPQYFAISSDGKILKPQVLTQPVYNNDFITNWAANAATKVHSYDFVHYRGQLQEASNNFTPKGWREFLGALKDSRQLEMVQAKHLVVSAVPTGTPVIVDQGVAENAYYAWKIQVPLLITYQSGTEQTPTPLLVNMVVVRVPTANSPQGIGINSFIESVSATGR